ncbi:MAG: TrkH family potassium uptake protein [Ignavibacteriales bacterium]|nr:TrkH family potassium uptake protein [Ignavibacteriales bacterium]
MLNLRSVFYIVGFLLVVEGAFLLTSLGFSLYYDDGAWRVILFSGLGAAAFGGAVMLLSRGETTENLRARDGYLIVTIGWLALSAVGAIPFVVHGAIPSYTDAFFETISGFTTTGASIMNDIESAPAGLLYWRSLTQWMGGMGIIVLSLAILPLLGIGGMQLFVAEMPGPTKDKVHPRVKETAKRLWGIYAALTAIETALLYAGGMSFFDAINHAFTTMATGGFSPKQASVAAYDSPFIHYVIVVFMFLAGVNFTIHYRALKGRFGEAAKNEEFRTYAAVLGVATLGVTAAILHYMDLGVEESFRTALFQVVSMTTTTGYVTADYELFAPFAPLLFFLLLFVGGSAGSTGGGVKISRHILLFKNGLAEFKRLTHPRAVIPVRFNGEAVGQDVMRNVTAFFLIYLFLFVVGAFALALTGLDFMTAMGASATCLGNVGPGVGGVGPVSNFAAVSDAGKWLLSALMLLGRLELFTALVIVSSAFWRR